MSFILKINDLEEAKTKFKNAINYLIELEVFDDLAEALKEFKFNINKWNDDSWKLRKWHVERIVKTYHVDGLYIYTNERVSIIQKGKETIEV